MNIKEFLEKQIKKLEERSTAINTMVEKATEKEEVLSLTSERSTVESSLTEFRAMLKDVESNDPEKQARANATVNQIISATTEVKRGDRAMRSKLQFAYDMMKRAGVKPVESDEELRAVGVAITDSATTFKAPAEGTDGDNNAGLFLSEDIVLDLLNEVALQSPILAAVRKMAVAGLVKMPYKVRRTGASKVKERSSSVANSSATAQQIEFANLVLVRGEIAARFILTFEIRHMALIDLYAYLREQMADALREELISQVIYGTGTDELKGILGNATVDMINVESTTQDVITMEDLETAYKSLPALDRFGAVAYVSTSVYDALSFARDKNGRWMYVRDNGELVKLAGKCAIIEDPYLNDGDVIIGNLSKNYYLNTERQPELGVDVINKDRIYDMNLWGMFSSGVVAKHMVYLKAKEGA